MKKILIIYLLLFASVINAQTQWQITYQYKRVETEQSKKRNDSLLKARPEWAAMMQKIRKRNSNKTFKLTFNQQVTLFKQEEELEKPNKQSSRRMYWSYGAKSTIFTNLNSKTYIKKQRLFEETFLINDSLPSYHWKITKESKQIGKYLVIKAIGTRTVKNRKRESEEKEIIAWFTPQIPIGTGPELYGGLPGLILELHMDNDVFLAKEILVNSKNLSKIEAPKDGKVVSQSEYEKVADERIKKLREMRKTYRKRRKNRRR
jgi:GLPGLI family protein